MVRRRVFFVGGLILGLLSTYAIILNTGWTLGQIPFLSSLLAFSLQNMDITGLLPDHIPVEDFMEHITGMLGPVRMAFESENGFATGARLAAEGLTATHPVILLPGIISTGLESWGTSACSQKYFRHRMWGTLTMFRAVLLDKDCWTQHMKLDPLTGMDPPGIRLRAAQGLDAADYFIGGYWIWGKIIENLAALGYDSNSMQLAAYDWRLAYGDLEKRDQYFSRLKGQIELAVKTADKKAVIVGHSMGANVFYYFMHWVESPMGGNGGKDWVETYIRSFINLAGPLLGLPKTLASGLSGEMKDTVQPMGEYVLERFYSRIERAALFRTWGGLASMLPKGGTCIWGGAEVPGERRHPGWSHDSIRGGHMISFSLRGTPRGEDHRGNLTVEAAMDLLRKTTPKHYTNMIDRHYSVGVERNVKRLEERREKDPRTWTNPLESRLPNAPSMRIWCLYGVGKETERAYVYRSGDRADPGSEGVDIWIDTGAQGEHLESGVRTSDGDGTVPLVSLGYMCVDGWRSGSRYNPKGVKVRTREYEHAPTSMVSDIRGGPATADHVDILGNAALMEDILRIATGADDTMEDRIITNITEISQAIGAQLKDE